MSQKNRQRYPSIDRTVGVAQPAAIAQMLHPDDQFWLEPPRAASAQVGIADLVADSRSSLSLSASRSGPPSARKAPPAYRSPFSSSRARRATGAAAAAIDLSYDDERIGFPAGRGGDQGPQVGQHGCSRSSRTSTRLRNNSSCWLRSSLTKKGPGLFAATGAQVCPIEWTCIRQAVSRVALDSSRPGAVREFG